jgi:hypothetical protein
LHSIGKKSPSVVLNPVPVKVAVVEVVAASPVSGDNVMDGVPELVNTGTALGVYVYWSLELVADVPSGVVTVTSTLALPAGTLTDSSVEEMTFTLVPLAVPKLTAVAPVKFVPTTIIWLPPEGGP